MALGKFEGYEVMKPPIEHSFSSNIESDLNVVKQIVWDIATVNSRYCRFFPLNLDHSTVAGC
jgi:hypothetical protein